MTYKTLREANTARQIEWDKKSLMDLSYSGNELAGEAGEFAEAVSDILNGGDDMEAVRQEIGDVVICCDLIAGPLGISLTVPDDGDPFNTSADALNENLVGLFVQIGMVCNTIKKMERKRLGMVGSQGSVDDLARNLEEVIQIVHFIARAFGTTANACVAGKFNMTSEKYGLKTRMVV